MLQYYVKNSALTSSQSWFVDKVLELLYQGTLDSYKPKTRGTYSLIQELMGLIRDEENQELWSFEYLKKVANECQAALKRDEIISFDNLDKCNLLKELGGVKADNCKELYYSLCFLHNNNSLQVYLDRSLQKILEITMQSNVTQKSYKMLEQVTNNFFSELIQHRYDKVYLFEFFRLHIVKRKCDFNLVISLLTDIVERKERCFILVYLLKNNFDKETREIIKSSKWIELEGGNTAELDNRMDRYLNTDAYKKFIKSYPDSISTIVFEKAYDYKSAIMKSNKQIDGMLDASYFVHNGKGIASSIHKFALLIDTSADYSPKEKVINKVFDYDFLKLYFKPTAEEFKNSLNTILSNAKISNKAKIKIISAMRYFRMSYDSIELEQKYINAWIALEYLFSANRRGINATRRIEEYLPYIMGLFYFKRNIDQLVKDCHERRFANVTEEMILDLNSRSNFISQAENSGESYLTYRLRVFDEILSDRKNIQLYISNNRTNIENQIARIYRYRNLVVHSATGLPDLAGLYANLRYYLYFVVNDLFRFMADPIDFNLSGEITLDDYFELRKTQYRMNILVNEKQIDPIKLCTIG